VKESPHKAFFDKKMDALQQFNKETTKQGNVGNTAPAQIVDRKLVL